MRPEPGVHCIADGCQNLASDERFLGVTADGDLIVELVCDQHRDYARIAVGGWHCPCAGLKIDNFQASAPVVSVEPICPVCGRQAEFVPLPLDAGAGTADDHE